MSLAQTLGRIPSGLFILTARQDDVETGMLASWVMQAGFEPPMLTVALRQDRYVTQWITDGRPFVLNLLGQDQKGMIAHFGRGFAPGEPAFEGVELSRTSTGLAILSGCVGHLECEAVGHVDSGDHRIVLARILAGQLQKEDSPLVHIRKNGLHY